MPQVPLNRLAVLATIIGVPTRLVVAALNWTVLRVERLVHGTDHLDDTDRASHLSPVRPAGTLLVLGVPTVRAWPVISSREQRTLPVIYASWTGELKWSSRAGAGVRNASPGPTEGA